MFNTLHVDLGAFKRRIFSRYPLFKFIIQINKTQGQVPFLGPQPCIFEIGLSLNLHDFWRPACCECYAGREVITAGLDPNCLLAWSVVYAAGTALRPWLSPLGFFVSIHLQVCQRTGPLGESIKCCSANSSVSLRIVLSPLSPQHHLFGGAGIEQSR